MSLPKLTQIHLIIIGTVLLIIAEAAPLYYLWKPQTDRFAAAEVRYNAAKTKCDSLTIEKAAGQKALAKAKDDMKIAEARMAAEMKRRMPSWDFSKRDVGMLAFWPEKGKIGPVLESFAVDKNVYMTPPSFPITAPPTHPGDSAFDQAIWQFDLGSLSATGDFKSLMKHVVRWNKCPRLVIVDGVSLSGNSPALTVSYSATCYVFPLATGGPTDPMWGGGGGGGGRAGMMPMAPGMGGPGGMPMPGGPAGMGRPGMPMPGGPAGMGRPGMPTPGGAGAGR